MKGNRFNFFGLMAVVALLSSLSLSAAAEPKPSKTAVVDARVAIFSSMAAQNALKAFEESADFMNLKAKLESLGHTLVPFTITLQEYIDLFDTYAGLARHSSVPGIWHLQKYNYEYYLPCYKLMMFGAGLPNWLKGILVWFLKKFTKE